MVRLGRGQPRNVIILTRGGFDAVVAVTAELASGTGSAFDASVKEHQAVAGLASGVGQAFNAAAGFVAGITSVAPAQPASRAALGGKYPPLSQNAQGYSQEEVESVMRSGVAVWAPRFELYDVIGNRVLPDLQGVTAAVVDYDETREIQGALQMEMLADERLRDAFFQYTIKPIVRVGPMHDGGFAEFPQGKYPWTKPERMIFGTTGQSETWKVNLGDQMHFLDVTGPGEEPFMLTAGELAYTRLRWLLYIAGFTNEHDYDGITPSDTPIAQDAWYTYVTTAKKDAGGEWKGGQQAETWVNIAQDLHGILGYAPPVFDSINGVYQGAPDRTWYSDPADVIYDTADDGVMLLPVNTQPDLKMIANRVKGWTQAPSGQQAQFGEVNTVQFQAMVDLNDWLPAHPLAAVNTKRYIDATLDKPTAGSYPELYAACLNDLFRRLAYYEKLTLKRVGFLAQHTGSGIVGVQITNDPELGGPVHLFQGVPESLPPEFQNLYDFTRPIALFRESGRKLNLFNGDGESTLTRLARLQ